MDYSHPTTIVVSIGRNIPAGQHSQNSEPLHEKAWEDFKAHTFTLITTARATVVSVSTGQGEWEGESEETFVVIAIIETGNVAPLREALRSVGARYGQDAIGFVSAPSTQTLIECA